MISIAFNQVATVIVMMIVIGAFAWVAVLRIRHAREELDRNDLSPMEIIKWKFILGTGAVMLLMAILIVLLFLFNYI